MDIALDDLFQHDIGAVKAILGRNFYDSWKTGRNLDCSEIRIGSTILFGTVVGDIKLTEMTVSGSTGSSSFHFQYGTDI